MNNYYLDCIGSKGGVERNPGVQELTNFGFIVISTRTWPENMPLIRRALNNLK